MERPVDPNFVASWLKDDGREGVQGTVSNNAIRSVGSRKNTPETGYSITSSIQSRSASDMLPFEILVYVAGTTSPSDMEVKHKLTMMINPSDLNVGSAQVQNSQYGRDGHINSLWGKAQPTLTGNGSSAAFINLDGGLANTAFSGQGVSKKDSLAYANMMSFVSLVRGNGYRHLTEGVQPGNLGIKANSDNPLFSTSMPTKETPEVDIPVSTFAPSAMPTAFIGDKRTRVIHVMDTLAISYGGTTYLGTFNSFTLEDDASSPFRFSYSFEFVVSGILGDNVEGHLSTGTNHYSGIKLFVQGVDTGGSAQTRMTLNFKAVNEYLKNTGVTRYATGSYLVPLVENGTIRALSGKTNLVELKTEIASKIPILAAIVAKYAQQVKDQGLQTDAEIGHWYPLMVTSAKDGTHTATNSLHYQGLAADFRSNGMPATTKKQILGEFRRVLGKDYDVLLHGPVEHFHIEYDPK